MFGMGTGVTSPVLPPGLVSCKEQSPWQLYNRGTDTHNDQANGAISIGQLSTFRYTCLDLRPINLVVFQGSRREN